jgi:hypothetical protein
MIHYNLALALIELKRPVEVAEHLEKAIEHGVEGLNGQVEKLDQAKRLLEFTLDQLATIEVSCQKEGAKVSVDGKHVFTVEKGKPNVYKGRVPIGKHTFVAELPGYATPVDSPLIDKRENFRIELKLYTAEELTRYKRRWEQRTWAPWAVIGGGALLGIVGGAMQYSASSSYRDFEDQVARCTAEAMNGSCDAAQFTDLKDSGDTKRTLRRRGRRDRDRRRPALPEPPRLVPDHDGPVPVGGAAQAAGAAEGSLDRAARRSRPGRGGGDGPVLGRFS